MIMNIGNLSRSGVFNILSNHLLTKEKFRISDRSFQLIFTIQREMITNNEIKNLSRNRTRGIERKIKKDDQLKILLNKIKTEKKKKKIKNLIKLKNWKLNQF